MRLRQGYYSHSSHNRITPFKPKTEEEKSSSVFCVVSGEVIKMEEAIGRIQVMFQSMLKEHEVSPNAVLDVGITVKKGKKECHFCGNTDPLEFAKGPCINCTGGECWYCLKCIGMGKVKACSVLIATPEKEQPFPKREEGLAHYKHCLSAKQEQLSLECLNVVKKTGFREHLLWAVTGSGKTEMIFGGVEWMLQQGKRVAIAAPRIDVCVELAPRLKEAFPTVEQNVLHSQSEEGYKRVSLTIATTHQMLRFYRAFDLVVIDETDSFPYRDNELLIRAVHRALKEDGCLLYLTATPSQTLEKRIRRKELSVSLLPERYHKKPLVVPMMTYSGDLEKRLRKKKVPKPLQRFIEEHVRVGKRFLLFVPRIALLSPIERALRRQFPNAKFETVSSKEPFRQERIAQMRAGMLDFLVTTTILERGVTFPGVDVCVINAHEEEFSREVLVQIAGRVGRTAECPTGEVVYFHNGKTKAMVQAVREIENLNQQALRGRKPK